MRGGRGGVMPPCAYERLVRSRGLVPCRFFSQGRCRDGVSSLPSSFSRSRSLPFVLPVLSVRLSVSASLYVCMCLCLSISVLPLPPPLLPCLCLPPPRLPFPFLFPPLMSSFWALPALTHAAHPDTRTTNKQGRGAGTCIRERLHRRCEQRAGRASWRPGRLGTRISTRAWGPLRTQEWREVSAGEGRWMGVTRHFTAECTTCRARLLRRTCQRSLR